MVAIPQEIIDIIIEEVGDDRCILKECALVSSSFLFPCRKHLFSKLVLRDVQACQRLHQLLVENPVVQSFVRSITITRSNRISDWNCTPLISILRLSFCCLESFSINMSSLRVRHPLNWNDFSRELKDALSTVIRSSTLKTLYVNKITLPTMLFLGINLTKLELTNFSPNEFDGEQSGFLTPAASDSEGVATTTASCWHTVVDHCKCNFFGPVDGTRFPTFAYFSLI